MNKARQGSPGPELENAVSEEIYILNSSSKIQSASMDARIDQSSGSG
jgi:hypothetical protein